MVEFSGLDNPISREFLFPKFRKKNVIRILGRKFRLTNILFPEFGKLKISHVAVSH
jgi:hypothetical protein